MDFAHSLLFVGAEPQVLLVAPEHLLLVLEVLFGHEVVEVHYLVAASVAYDHEDCSVFGFLDVFD